MISFAGGNPSNAALEPEVISELAVEALAKYGTSLLQYGATEGFAPFVESAGAFLAEMGVKAGPGELLPVQGGTQGFDLLMKVLLEPGDVILAEDPSFLGALQAMHTYNARIIPVATDENGVIPEDVEEKIKKYSPKLMYIIPSFQNPTGVTLSLERRKAWRTLPANTAWCLPRTTPTAICATRARRCLPSRPSMKQGWVVYLSKLLQVRLPRHAPGARRWATSCLIRKMTIGKQSTDLHSPLLVQAIIDAYLRKGLMPAHLKRICGDYKKQLNAMLEGFKYLPAGTRHTVPEGGLFVWAELPEGMDAKALLDKCVENNVAYVPGTFFYVEGGHENTMRLNFSNATIEDIDKGMRALGAALAQ